MSATETHASWWQTDSAGSPTLVVTRTTDAGATWTPPQRLGTRDRSRTRCEYPPPAIAADSATGYVHLAFFLHPEEGAGVWYSHSMDRGRTWHPNTALIFGEAPARASIDADGWMLAVAYEAPSQRNRDVWVSLSRDAGHTFERAVRVVSSATRAGDPHVALNGSSIAIKWAELLPNGGVLREVVREGIVSGDANPRVAKH